MRMKRRMLIIFCVLAMTAAGTGCGEKAAEDTSAGSESSVERPVQEVFEEETEKEKAQANPEPTEEQKAEEDTYGRVTEQGTFIPPKGSYIKGYTIYNKEGIAIGTTQDPDTITPAPFG